MQSAPGRSRPLTLGLLLAAAACAAGISLAGCGHPATKEECIAIFNKSAELKLRRQDITDKQEIEVRTRELMEARGEDLIDKCVGRTLTKSALECVQRADSEAAVDKCLY